MPTEVATWTSGEVSKCLGLKKTLLSNHQSKQMASWCDIFQSYYTCIYREFIGFKIFIWESFSTLVLLTVIGNKQILEQKHKWMGFDEMQLNET